VAPSQPDDRDAFSDAVAALSEFLSGPARAEIVAALAFSRDLGTALQALRASMRAHQWQAPGVSLRVDRAVAACDRQARAGGFHILHDWDGLADRVNPEMIPVDMLNFLIDQRGAAPSDRRLIAILLDYYFFYLLTLLSVRVWDADDPNARLDALSAVLAALQGPHGSGQRFVGDAETLLLIVGSHYEPREDGFDALLAQVRTLDDDHARRVAIGHAASLGSHLRFGFEATYARDIGRMRADNVVDYPWLCFSLATLLRGAGSRSDEGAESPGDRAAVEALFNGLSADIDAMLGATPPASLAAHTEERNLFRETFLDLRPQLIEGYATLRPTERAYSPLAFYFNFCQNVLKGIVADALLWGEVWPVSLNDVLTASPEGDDQGAAKLALTRTLTGYARANPDPIRGRLMPAIFYDVTLGRRAFAAAMRRLEAGALGL
jgi:hypothetical protein